MATFLTFEPLDVWMFRGNRLFGGGVHGMGLMPPWPSVVTGAVVSRALADNNRLGDVTRRPDQALNILQQCLGEDFGLTHLGLLKQDRIWFPTPADLVVMEADGGGLEAKALEAKPKPSNGACCSAAFPYLCILPVSKRKKTVGNMWIDLDGLKAHLAETPVSSDHLMPAGCFWQNDPRLGIAIGTSSRTVEEGAIYTTDAVSLNAGVSLIAGFSGRNVPSNGLVRLGGDGRGARIQKLSQSDQDAMATFGQPQAGWKGFRMILATAGLFPDGVMPPVVKKDHTLELDGLTAELVAASVPQPGVVSGWDIAKHQPKPAHRIAAAGSCYWFRVISGDTEQLMSLWENGLRENIAPNHPLIERRHEGWNRVWFGQWNPSDGTSPTIVNPLIEDIPT